jgi:uncharacterized protein YprB with RNaseH-like and TPR domain
MNLEEKLRQLKQAAQKGTREIALERQLEYLRRLQAPKELPAQRAPSGIEAYVEGQLEENGWGTVFSARQTLPFGRPYGRLRIGDLSTENLSSLDLFLEENKLPCTSELVYLDTETTGLSGGTGTCAFLIGIGAADGAQFTIRQFFLRDYPEEKAMLAALAEALARYHGIVTFNGKSFDLPLLETRYSLARMESPFARLLHLDLLHPARRLWKLRLENCNLTHLEDEVLGIRRQGDVEGSEIPGIYFNYLRTGNACGLQPVFYHNALDIITLAALTVELARTISHVLESAPSSAGLLFESSAIARSNLQHNLCDESKDKPAATIPLHPLDLFSLSRIFERAGVPEHSVATCERALAAGLPEPIETRALLHLATQHKRQRRYERAVEVWTELGRREADYAVLALEQLAMHYEHRRRDVRAALLYVETALSRLGQTSSPEVHERRFSHRMERLQRKLSGALSSI